MDQVNGTDSGSELEEEIMRILIRRLGLLLVVMEGGMTFSRFLNNLYDEERELLFAIVR